MDDDNDSVRLVPVPTSSRIAATKPSVQRNVNINITHMMLSLPSGQSTRPSGSQKKPQGTPISVPTNERRPSSLSKGSAPGSMITAIRDGGPSSRRKSATQTTHKGVRFSPPFGPKGTPAPEDYDVVGYVEGHERRGGGGSADVDRASRSPKFERHGSARNKERAPEVVLLSDEDEHRDPRSIKRKKISQDYPLLGPPQANPITVKYKVRTLSSAKSPSTSKPSLVPLTQLTPPQPSRVRHLGTSTSPITPEKMSAMGTGTYPQAQLLGVRFNNGAGFHSPDMRLQFAPDRLVLIVDKVVTRIPHSDLKMIEYNTMSDVKLLLIDTKSPLDSSSNLAPYFNPEPPNGRARVMAIFCNMEGSQLTARLKELHQKGVCLKPLESDKARRIISSYQKNSNTEKTEQVAKTEDATSSLGPKEEVAASPSRILFTYPFSGGPKSITIHESDVARLEPEQFLNDTLIEFGLKFMQDDLENVNPDLAKQIHVFNSFFYERLSEKDAGSPISYNKVRKWTSKVDLFSKKYILVPVHESAHWYLAIITNPGLLLDRGEDSAPTDAVDADTNKGAASPVPPASPKAPLTDSSPDSSETGALDDTHNKRPLHGAKNPAKPEVDPSAKPYIIVLDSLDLRHPTIFNNLRNYLQHELLSKKDLSIKVTNAEMIGKYAKWPRQGNHCDCGVFLLHYAKTFLKDPEKMLWSIVNSVNNENMWSDEEITKLRERYKDDMLVTRIKYSVYQTEKQVIQSAASGATSTAIADGTPIPNTSTPTSHSAAKARSTSPFSASTSPTPSESPSSTRSHSMTPSNHHSSYQEDSTGSCEDANFDSSVADTARKRRRLGNKGDDIKQPTPEELAAHRRQQQEYEEAVRSIHSLVENIRHDPMKTNKIRVHGTAKTREGFMHRALAPLFEARSLHEVIGLSRQMVHKLERFGIFEDVKVQLDSPREDFLADRKDRVDVGFWVKEGSRVQIKTGTEAGNAEASAYGSLTVKNVFGGAETLNTSMAFGTRTSSAFQFSLATPLLADPDKNLSLNLFSQSRNNTYWSSHEEDLKGGSVKYTTLSRLGYHEFAYDGHWREITRPSENASMSIREQCGHSLKSALSHLWIHDQRDEPLMPSTGHYLRVFQEYAGLGGDVEHLRHEVEGQVVRSNARGYILSATMNAGYLHSLNGKPSKLSDRFFLGGPMSVRGFKSFGLGPRDGGDSLGGDAYVSAGVSLLTPFPGFPAPDASVKGHLFANAGSLVAVTPSSSTTTAATTMRRTAEDLTKTPSVSVGAGVVYRHPQVRIELNFAVPLVASQSDAVSRGWQFGLGIRFL
ncbi:hypothetical protein DFQ27_002213 [Actinomortierella ambigua]|uniref:Ubiquitin-like protease family profile domain-containing protein n=1 Tax=Actinomortierella ambigua TaxID=1343610 RepID=A0A9P6Q821_9FUNG|nr:hypothetical protein DFQ27_002213 [Actinomortierella ambigua]